MTTFSFPEKGSRVLREFVQKRQLERAIAARHGTPTKRNFAGAAISRLTSSLDSWSGAINADLDNGLAILRARARTLCANNEFGKRFLALVAANVVGPHGPTLQVRALTTTGALDKPANDAVEIHWKRWSETADITGRMTLTRALQVLVKGVARDGEALVRIVRGGNLPYGIQLQLLEPDRLDEALNVRFPGGGMIRQGVELDQLGRRIAYHLLTAHPGENYVAGARTTEPVPAKDIFHVYLPERAEQVRGYTWLHAILMRAHMLHGFEEAAVVAARVGASKMGVWVKDPEAASALETIADTKDASGNLQMSAEPGDFIEAPSGYSLESWNPEYPHANFESFLKACIRGLAVGTNVASHNMSGDMSEVNYSSARIAELAEREVWRELQEWLIASFLKPLFREWLASALLRGDIRFEQSGKSLPSDRFAKFSDVARFQGRRWEWVDPLKDAQASELLIKNGLASRTSIAASQGREFEDIVDELQQEQVLMKAAGLMQEDASGSAGRPLGSGSIDADAEDLEGPPDQAAAALLMGLAQVASKTADCAHHIASAFSSTVAALLDTPKTGNKGDECQGSCGSSVNVSVFSPSNQTVVSAPLTEESSGGAPASAVDEKQSAGSCSETVMHTAADALSTTCESITQSPAVGGTLSGEGLDVLLLKTSPSSVAQEEPCGAVDAIADQSRSSVEIPLPAESPLAAVAIARSAPPILPASDSQSSPLSNEPDAVPPMPSGDASATAGPSLLSSRGASCTGTPRAAAATQELPAGSVTPPSTAQPMQTSGADEKP